MAIAVRYQAAARLPAMAILASVAVLIVHLPAFAHRLLDGDEAVYGSIAALMNQGGTLYGDGGVDNKPPGIFWTYAITFDLFGTFQMTAVHLVALAIMAATCVLLFVIGRSVSGPRAGLLAATFYGLLTATGNPRLLAANTELFMTLPLTAAFLLMLRRQWLWSGLLMVIAGAFKQVAAAEVLILPVGLLVLEARGARTGALVRFGAGILLGLAAGAAALALTGSLGGFWRWTVETLAGYAAGNWSPAVLLDRSEGSLIPFVATTIVLWVAAGSVAARWRTLWPAERLAVAWLAVSIVGSVAGGHWSWHYFIQAMAPLALLAALGIDRALDSPLRRWVAFVVVIGVTVPAAGWTTFNFRADPLTYDWSPPIAQHEQVAAYIRAHTTSADRVFVWGDWPALYVESDRLMSSRFPGFLRGFARASGLPPNNWDTAPDVWPALQSDLERHPPQLIVDTSTDDWSDFGPYPMSGYPLLASLVASSYHPVATIDGVVIYARNT
jgi:4-amino-4-deoxy-L-arabinose transferase-like glycosyltransferase